MQNNTYHREDLKSELVMAGIDFINEYGVDKFSLRKVASICGVSHAAPYKHFSSKEALIKEMRNHISEEFSNELIQACQENAEHRLLELGKSYIMFFVNNPKYFDFIFKSNEINFVLNTEIDFRPFNIFKEQMITLLKRTETNLNQYDDIIFAHWAFVHGIAELATKSGMGPEYWKNKSGDIISCLITPNLYLKGDGL